MSTRVLSSAHNQDRQARMTATASSSNVSGELMPTEEELEEARKRAALRMAALRLACKGTEPKEIIDMRPSYQRSVEGQSDQASDSTSSSLGDPPPFTDHLEAAPKDDQGIMFLCSPGYTLIEPVTRSLIIDHQSPLLSYFPYLNDWENDGLPKRVWKMFRTNLIKELQQRKERLGPGAGIERVINILAFKDADIGREDSRFYYVVSSSDSNLHG
jgi:hypothetical protein